MQGSPEVIHCGTGHASAQRPVRQPRRASVVCSPGAALRGQDGFLCIVSRADISLFTASSWHTRHACLTPHAFALLGLSPVALVSPLLSAYFMVLPASPLMALLVLQAVDLSHRPLGPLCPQIISPPAFSSPCMCVHVHVCVCPFSPPGWQQGKGRDLIPEILAPCTSAWCVHMSHIK